MGKATQRPLPASPANGEAPFFSLPSREEGRVGPVDANYPDQFTQPPQAVMSTSAPKISRYQAKGTKLCPPT